MYNFNLELQSDMEYDAAVDSYTHLAAASPLKLKKLSKHKHREKYLGLQRASSAYEVYPDRILRPDKKKSKSMDAVCL